MRSVRSCGGVAALAVGPQVSQLEAPITAATPGSAGGASAGRDRSSSIGGTELWAAFGVCAYAADTTTTTVAATTTSTVTASPCGCCCYCCNSYTSTPLPLLLLLLADVPPTWTYVADLRLTRCVCCPFYLLRHRLLQWGSGLGWRRWGWCRRGCVCSSWRHLHGHWWRYVHRCLYNLYPTYALLFPSRSPQALLLNRQ